ncbi:hypothetical protein A0256_13620 [Mucilaginibacter sp. PAMC 26640]|nr:hypothetical protein A0256_13620 [Mucilaginibacter sp. PAMC 26640]
MNLNKYILHKAIDADICKEWAVKINQANGVDDLLKMYVAGIDFCLKNNFPDNADILTLGEGKLAAYGIHIDEIIALQDKPLIVLLGDCIAKHDITGYTSSQLFIKHNSKATVTATDNAFLMIDCFDDSVLNLSAGGRSKVYINIYGNAQVTHTCSDIANVKITNKNKLTY